VVWNLLSMFQNHFAQVLNSAEELGLEHDTFLFRFTSQLRQLPHRRRNIRLR
jgi:hypothetical protein